jgi:two-component SAPR family response regulator
MPIMNGFEFIKKVKELDNSIKVCFITAFEEYYQFLMEQFNLNEKCFIKKSISKDELIKHIVEELITLD